MRQKVGYLESVNAELCEQLERCDAEAFSHQGGLQAEKAELAARMRQLQEEVRTLLSAWLLSFAADIMNSSHCRWFASKQTQPRVTECWGANVGVCPAQVVRLQERSSSYLAELEELKTARSSKSLLGAAAGGAAAGGVPAAAAAVAAKSAAADKELMLKQIDSLKEVRSTCLGGGVERLSTLQTHRRSAYCHAKWQRRSGVKLTRCRLLLQARTEAEHMRLEVRRLESSLDRKEVQLMELQVIVHRRFCLTCSTSTALAVLEAESARHAAGLCLSVLL
jgi:hypothetical protein